jgi:8-amino-7-oxononanoate synthase
MALFDKLKPLAEARQQLAELGVEKFNVIMEEVLSATEAVVNGRRVILAGTNNYLGLTYDSDCIAAAAAAARSEGTGTTGSRMANGTLSGHVALERELADFYGCRHAIVFSTGFVANLGMIAGLAGPGDVLLIDADCHASIYDGCRLSGADILRFRHNNPADLEKRLRRLKDRVENTIIIVEGIYSMLGDRAPLAEIAAVKQACGGYLMVDEAHSLGVLGENGRGLCEEAGVEDAVDFVVGTFSKSLGSIGGFCVSDHPELELVRYASRPYVFTASSSPSTIASTRKALEIIRTRPELRKRLRENAERLYSGLQAAGFRLGPDLTPVIAVRLEKTENAFSAWKQLLAEGVYVNLVLPPATPDGGSMLRCSVSAAHSPEQIEKIRAVFARLPAAWR